MDAHDHRTRILRLLHHERDEIETALAELYRQRLLPELHTERDRLVRALADTREQMQRVKTRPTREKYKR